MSRNGSYLSVFRSNPKFIPYRVFQSLIILWNHHCSWGTNVGGFCGQALSTNLHPHELIYTNICLIFIYNVWKYVPTNKENLGHQRTLTARNKNDSTVFSYLAQVGQYHRECLRYIVPVPGHLVNWKWETNLRSKKMLMHTCICFGIYFFSSG